MQPPGSAELCPVAAPAPPAPVLPAQHPRADAGRAGTPAGAEGSRAPSALTFLCPGSFSPALEGLRRSMVLGPGGKGTVLGQAPGTSRTEAPAPRPGSTQEAGGHMRGACSGADQGACRVRRLGQEEGNPPRSCRPAQGPPWGGGCLPAPCQPVAMLPPLGDAAGGAPRSPHPPPCKG